MTYERKMTSGTRTKKEEKGRKREIGQEAQGKIRGRERPEKTGDHQSDRFWMLVGHKQVNKTRGGRTSAKSTLFCAKQRDREQETKDKNWARGCFGGNALGEGEGVEKAGGGGLFGQEASQKDRTWD